LKTDLVFAPKIHLFCVWIECTEEAPAQYWLKDCEDSSVGDMDFLLKRRGIIADIVLVVL